MSADVLGTSTERAYEDAVWEFENSDNPDTPELIRALYASAIDYVGELTERLTERDDLYSEALGVLSEAYGALTGQTSREWDDLREVGYYAEVMRDESQGPRDGMERYHRDHHTGPAHMCWQDACAYVNDNHGAAWVQGQVSA